MATFKLNGRYDVTLGLAGKVAKGFKVEGNIWDRLTGKPTEIRVSGEGRTVSAAQDRARAEAREKCPLPEDDE